MTISPKANLSEENFVKLQNYAREIGLLKQLPKAAGILLSEKLQELYPD